MRKKTLKPSPPSQILFKEVWRMYNNGGQWLDYVEDISGDELLEPVKLENIVPGKLYYMRQIYKPIEFKPTVFDPSVSWSTIEELYKTGRIWQRKENQQELKVTDTNSR